MVKGIAIVASRRIFTYQLESAVYLHLLKKMPVNDLQIFKLKWKCCCAIEWHRPEIVSHQNALAAVSNQYTSLRYIQVANLYDSESLDQYLKILDVMTRP